MTARREWKEQSRSQNRNGSSGVEMIVDVNVSGYWGVDGLEMELGGSR